jgi:lipopolysaccharide biosynthesis glycosyltransferase
MKSALVLACDDNFVAYAAIVARRVAMLSSESFPIVIVSDGVTDENKRLAQKFCPRISFIEAGQMFQDRRFYTHSGFTRATYLRLFFDDILADFDRAAYIDCDVSPLVDLSPLVGFVPKASPIAGTYDLVQLYDQLVHDRLPLSKEAGYLQTGVLVLDLKAIRGEHIFKDAMQFALDNLEKCKLVDQDALNVVLQGRWQVLDWRWNVLHFCVNRMPKPFFIRHSTGYKPWARDKEGIEPYIVRRWASDLADSPWPHKFHAWVKAPGYFKRRYVRPVARAIETPFKTLFRSPKPHFDLNRYLKNLPSTIRQVESAAKAGDLGRALTYPK